MKKTFLCCFMAFWSISKAQNYAAVTDTIFAESIEAAMIKTFGLLPKSHYPTGYLIEKGGPRIKTLFANGQLNDSSFNMVDWYFLQNVIRNSYHRPDSIEGYTSIDSLKELYIDENDILPWGLIDMNVNSIKDDAFTNSSLIINDFRIQENTTNLSMIYTEKKLFSAVPLKMDIYTFHPSFILKSEDVLSNNTNAITKIEIDLDDGTGYRIVEMNVPFSANYVDEGYKQFITKITYNNSDVLYSKSELYINDPEANKSSSSAKNFDKIIGISTNQAGFSTFTETYPTEFDEGFHVESGVNIGIWFGCGNNSQKIHKPLVIFAGYNPKNGKSLSANTNAPWINDNFGPLLALAGWRGPMYETYNGFFTSESKDPSHVTGSNGNEFLEKVRAEGYDVIIVEFIPGIKYLQNNAFLCAKVLNFVNKEMEQDNITFNPGADLDPLDSNYPNSTTLRKARHEIVVIGYSAGALSSRLGLLMMEYQHENNKCAPLNTASKYPKHRVKTWIGMDCESQGSNVPIGFQMFLDFQKIEKFHPANNGDIVNSIISKAALDLLTENGIATQNTLYSIDNLQYQGNSNWSVGHHPDFDDYFEDLTDVSTYNPANLKGYPKDCYRIGVSMGSANGYNQLLSGTQLMYNQSPTSWCVSPAGAVYSVGSPGLSATYYREAEAKAITSSNNNAFSCKVGISFQTFFYSWHVSVSHSKYHNNNHVNDQYLGTAQPYDITAASMLPSHKLIAEKLVLSASNPVAFSSSTPFMAAFAHCNLITYNTRPHGFCPTGSALDLHAPGQNTLPRLPDLSLSPANMNFLYQNNYNNILDFSSNKDFGFPHLTHPNDHYDYSPYDAIWANGLHNTNSYDENTLHVEDPNPHTGEFLAEEIAPHTLYLSNRTIQGESCGSNPNLSQVNRYYADFEARNSVLAGDQTIYQHNTTNNYERVRTQQGNFIIENGGVVTMRANNDDGMSSVVLGAGFSAKHGSVLRAYIYKDAGMCAPFSYGSARMAQAEKVNSIPVRESRSVLMKSSGNSITTIRKKEGLGPYPNPTNGSVIYNLKNTNSLKFIIHDVSGKELESGDLNNKHKEINLTGFKPGVYFITIIDEEYKQTDRIIVQE